MKVSKDVIDQLEKELKSLNEERNKVISAINSLQALCEHKFVVIGHDSHKDHYKCSICGLTEEW